MESLFVYGTLGPGRPNAHVLEKIGGSWTEGHVGGSLLNKGWGAEMGFPGIVL
ncbi:gamma-glutamylcyclotransferase, partial [Salmonella enterica subsp. enterica serovar Javiana]|nr:gamma-glutamylcyclotransferase [Salmonella enterica subsp. enterica serovar Javiana]